MPRMRSPTVSSFPPPSTRCWYAMRVCHAGLAEYRDALPPPPLRSYQGSTANKSALPPSSHRSALSRWRPELLPTASEAADPGTRPAGLLLHARMGDGWAWLGPWTLGGARGNRARVTSRPCGSSLELLPSAWPTGRQPATPSEQSRNARNGFYKTQAPSPPVFALSLADTHWRT